MHSASDNCILIITANQKQATCSLHPIKTQQDLVIFRNIYFRIKKAK